MIPASYTFYGDKSGRSYDDVDNQDWGRVFRLLFISGLATLASVGNIFTISAIIGDDLLRKKGNSFLASITLADLLISALVLPASAVAILGQMEDSESICRLQYGIGSMSCLTAAMFTAAIGIENFLRLKSLCHNEKNRERQQKEQEARPARESTQLSSPPSANHHHQTSSSINPHYQHHGLGHGLHHHNQRSSTSSTSPYHTTSHHHSNSNNNATTSFTTLPNQSSSSARASPQPPPPPIQQPPPPPIKTSICTVFQLTLLNLKMWFVSGVIVLVHFIFLPQLMYSLCGKSTPASTTILGEPIPKTPLPINQQLLFESVTVLGICSLSLVSLGGLGFLKCACIIHSWKKPKPYLTSREFALIATNCWNCLIRFLIWTPSILIVIMIQFGRTIEAARLAPTSYDYSSSSSLGSGGGTSGFALTPLALSSWSPDDPIALRSTSSSSSSTVFAINNEYSFLHKFLIWPMILPSCLSSLVNIITNRDFRRCYVQLFHYCCCKTSVALSRRPRENAHAAGSDVRVHIIPGYNMYSAGSSAHSQVSAPQPRFATFKFGPHSSRNTSSGGGKRDVYEL